LINSSSREVEALYGGDLLGNLWRVDFGPAAARSANVADWKVAFNSKPLFTAKSHANAVQPITVKPTLARNPLAGGRMVLFGTGKLFDTEDPDDKAMQSFYSVHDVTAEGTSAATTDLSAWTAPVNHRDKLQQQTIDTTPVQRQNANTGETVNFYKTSAETVDWHTQRGWFMDLTLDAGTANAATANGQRTVYDAVMVDDFVWISTIVPGAAPVDCGSTSGVGYNFLLPAVTGAMYTLPVLDTNGDGKVDDGDDVVSGIGKRSDGSDAVLAKPPFEGTDGTKTYLFSNTEDSNTGQTYCIFNCTRVIRDRIWRQLIDPPKPD
jgi:type IV pilus assembly protein PilY1